MKKILHHGAILCLALTAAIVWPAGHLRAESAEPTEYQVKAAFLYNFARFVEWPPETFKDPADPLIIGILGDDPFGKEITEQLNVKLVQDRKLMLKSVTSLDEAAHCQVVFIGVSERERLGATLEKLRTTPTLTVSDIKGFAQRGGMIGFSLDHNHVRFSVNLTAAEKAGLKISSQLLKLARTVYGKPASDIH